MEIVEYFDEELLAAVLNYFAVGTWKPSMGIQDLEAFKPFEPSAIKSVIYALNELQLLTKHPDTKKKDAIWRFDRENLEQWRDMLTTVLNEKNIIPKLPLTDLAMLYVIGQFICDHGRTPTQQELYFRDQIAHTNDGLVNQFLRKSGMIEKVTFFVTGPMRIHESAQNLASHGLMIARGSRKRRQRFELTDRGQELYIRLRDIPWQLWYEVLNS